MNQGPIFEPRPADDEPDRDEPAWALGYEAALPWLTRAAPPRDDGARVAAPAAE